VKRPLIDPSLAYVDLDEEGYFRLWLSYYPAGSGPLGVMKTVCALIESICHLRGIDTSQWPARATKELS